DRTRIITARTPGLAKRMGNKVEMWPDWDDLLKYTVMRVGLRAKFTQNADLKSALLDTGTAHLIEASPYDEIWGNGADGNGANHLGRMLVVLRDELRQEGYRYRDVE
ncbi:hypothetical protein LCGC14_2323630, partial [marine sediment metagenome]